MLRLWALKNLKEYKKCSIGLSHKYGQNNMIKTGVKIKSTNKEIINFFLLFCSRSILIRQIKEINIGKNKPKILTLINNADTIANIIAFLIFCFSKKFIAV